MGIQIRYQAPAGAGTAFVYSMERLLSGSFFDFELCEFRSRGDIPSHAIVNGLRPHDGALVAYFDYANDGESYIIRIHPLGGVAKVVAALEVIACDDDGPNNGGQPMEPSYRSGKKFVGGMPIAARYRLTVYGDDGFTIHTATLWEDGTSSCNCPAWTRKDWSTGIRSCKHSKRAMTLTANVDETGEQPEPAPPPRAVPAANPFGRRSRPVDT